MDETNSIDIFNRKAILKWCFIIGISLAIGYVLKDKYAILFFGTIIFLNYTHHKNIAFFLFLIWVYTYKFFTGQGLITSSYFVQMEKLGYLLFIITFFQGIKECTHPFMKRLLVIHLGFLILIIISYIISSYDLTRVFIRFTCFFIFLIIVGSNFEKKDYITICHLILAIAIVQNVVSIMQYTGVINPPRTTFATQTTTTEWVAALNDSQCGTFGAVASNYVSWFLSLMSLLVMSYGLIKNKLGLVLFGIVLLFQFAISESKTILGITLLFFAWSFYRMVKYKQLYNINLFLLFKTLLIIFFTAQVFIIAWQNYYVSLESANVPKPAKEVSRSFDLLKKDPLGWGKITGYTTVAKMQYEEYPLKVLFGFGIGEYDWGNREYLVVYRDVSAMSYNNFTNSRSSLIHYFAELGIVGMILLFFLYLSLWQYYKKTEFKTTLGQSMKILFAPFIIASFVLGFIYLGIQFNNSYPVLTFWILTSVLVKLEMFEHEPLKQTS